MSLEKPKLLIIDDNQANILSYREILEFLNIQVIEAHDSQSVLKQVIDKNLFAIIMGAHLENMDGIMIASTIHQDQKTSHIPIIFVTGIGRDEEHMLKGYQAGAVDYLSKPINKDILISKIQVFLDLFKQLEILEDQNIKLEESNKALNTITEENIQYRQDAEIASNKKSEFLASMSHEIRTPMSGVMGMISLALDTSLSHEQSEYMETALSSAKSLLQIINDILDFSKIEAGKIDLEIIPFNLKHLIEESLSLMKLSAESKNIKLQLEYASHVPAYVAGDPGRIRQILFNLISNAIKFTEIGHISVNVSIESSSGKDKTFKIMVTDSGIGIPQDKQKHIFEKYSQADSSPSRNFGGTGLGLAICNRLVDLMKGEIGLISDLNKGSTFWVLLPLKISDPEKENTNLREIKAQEIDPATFAGSKILLAEDNHTNQMIATALLKRCECIVVCASNGYEAIKLLKEHDYHMILMDCQMPEMDGYEATTEIRLLEKKGIIKKTPIIAVTANAMRGEKNKCIDVGMDDYISKPVSFQALQRALTKWSSKNR